MAHWYYLVWALGGPAGIAAAWRYMPEAILKLRGGLTKDPQIHRHCAEMVRLSRKDAKDLASYLTDSPGSSVPPALPLQDVSAGTSAIQEAPPPHARAS